MQMTNENSQPTRLGMCMGLLALGASSLIACGGGGGGGSSAPSSANGQIVDSLVQGLSYQSGSFSGLTDVNGRFQYSPGGEVTFSVGDITLGTVSGASVLSIVDFVSGVDSYGGNDKVINIARFLQTIDENGFPADGITISAATRAAAAGKSLEFDMSPTDWSSDPDVIATVGQLTNNSIVSAAEAIEHGNAWLAAARAGEYAGSWNTDDGGLSGDIRLSVSTAGEVILIVGLDSGDTGGFSSIPLSADGSFSVDTSVASFTGTITGTSVSGLWTGSGDFAGQTGSFTSSLIVNPQTFLDAQYIDGFAFLDNAQIVGTVLDDDGSQTATFTMFMQGDSYGRYEVSMEVDFGGEMEVASFYVISMNASSINFRGLCTSGEGFSGTLNIYLSDGSGDGNIDWDAAVTGEYYNLDSSDPGGTFSGFLD